MIAYHNDPAVKIKYVNRMKAHMEADNLVQGTGWDGRKGCAVGCTFEYYGPARGPVEIGVPETLLWLEDAIFEGLFWDEAREFPLAFLEVIPVGADLSLVWPRFALWLLSDPDHGVQRSCSGDTRPSVEAVADLYRRWIGGDKPSTGEFGAAARLARVAAWATRSSKVATRAAAWAAAEAAEAATWAVCAEGATLEAAEAATWAACAANVDFWIAARDELLRLLQDAPVVVG